MTAAQLSPWDIDEGIRNAESFFRVLPKLFPDANLFIAQGSRIAADVAAFYRRHTPAVHSRPADLSRFTLTRRFFCVSSPDFFFELARFAAKKPREQLLHHLYLYRDGSQLIEWHDAFANAMFLSADLPETTISALASKFGVRYRRSRSG
jgi:hypothetical protein